MAGLTEFSGRDWDLAPRYKSGAATSGLIVLNLKDLKEISDQEEANNAFRTTPDNSFGKAPIYVDGTPAALYLLNTNSPEDYSPAHDTADEEILVVVDGILRYSRIGEDRPGLGDPQNMAWQTDVVKFENDSVTMQAVGVLNPARALALALFRDYSPFLEINTL